MHVYLLCDSCDCNITKIMRIISSARRERKNYLMNCNTQKGNRCTDEKYYYCNCTQAYYQASIDKGQNKNEC